MMDVIRAEKRFAMTVGGLVILLLIGRIIVGVSLDPAEAREQSENDQAWLEENWTTLDAVTEVEQRGAVLKQERSQLEDRLYVVARPPFLLPEGTTDPEHYFSRTLQEKKDEILGKASVKGVIIKEDWGFPSKRDERLPEEKLLALDIITRVLLEAIEVGVVEVKAIYHGMFGDEKGLRRRRAYGPLNRIPITFRIEGEAGALARLSFRLATTLPGLSITESRFTKEDPELPSVTLEITVSGLLSGAEVAEGGAPDRGSETSGGGQRKWGGRY